MRTFLLWGLFFVFVFCAIYFNWHENIFRVEKPRDAGKILFWAAFIGFTAYSIYCSRREDLFKTIKIMSGLHWGRQIGIDLYIGASIFAFFIYLHSGSILVLLLWLLPLIAFVNLATLLYLAIHYDSIVEKFLG
ncbi:MAG: hypothetical protein HKN25_13430 [Pyrinomonadaceae bacterium]|nr:hypothetical protein [Pyrinomonadaceae bacterium]